MENLSFQELVLIRQNFDSIVDKQILKFICHFQDMMWNGYDDENDPSFLTVEEFDSITALAGKLAHMLKNIGSGVTVFDMLDSICTRKIKHWQGYRLFYGGYDEGGWVKGRQLKTSDERRAMLKYSNHNTHTRPIIKGHFRWNNRGYILTRRVTDLIRDYNLQGRLLMV